jgi:hypothetical protein
MRKLMTFVVVVVLYLGSMGASCGGIKPQDCTNLKLGADAACVSGTSQMCTAAQVMYSAAGCGTYIPVDPCIDKEPKCSTQVSFECWTKNDNKCEFVPKPVEPVICPVCPTGQSCTNPSVGCVPDVIIPPTTCTPACKSNETCVNLACVANPVVTDYCITPGPDWQLQPRTAAPHNDVLNTIMAAETGCDVSSDCVIRFDRIDFMNRVIAVLNGQHLCAGVQVINGDKVAVGTQYDNWTYHLVGTGRNTVAWQPSKSEPPDHWIAVGPSFPPMKQFGRESGELKVTHPNCWVIDGTPLTGDSDYCKAEFPDNSAQWYLCPYSGEDNPEQGITGKKEKRIAGETAAGPYTLKFNGELQGPNTNADGTLNPLQMKICGAVTGIAEICAYNYGDQKCQTAEVK